MSAEQFDMPLLSWKKVFGCRQVREINWVSVLIPLEKCSLLFCTPFPQARTQWVWKTADPVLKLKRAILARWKSWCSHSQWGLSLWVLSSSSIQWGWPGPLLLPSLPLFQEPNGHMTTLVPFLLPVWLPNHKSRPLQSSFHLSSVWFFVWLGFPCFWDRVSLCSTGCSQNYNPSASAYEGWDYKCAPPCLAFIVFWITNNCKHILKKKRMSTLSILISYYRHSQKYSKMVKKKYYQMKDVSLLIFTVRCHG
jgi:hypothetical protein